MWLRGKSFLNIPSSYSYYYGARCGSVVRALGDGVMGRRIDPSWGGPMELFLIPASAPRDVVMW